MYFIFATQFFRMEFVYLIIGCFLGFAIGWFFSKSKNTSSGISEKEFQNLKTELNAERDKLLTLTREKTTVETQFHTQKAEIENLQIRFKTEFENLANNILKEKTKEFTEQNKTNLSSILDPLKDKIKTFEEKVEKSYNTESAERNSLKGEIKSLVLLNKQISEEANNLAKALKGDSKKQGNWGEIILEKVLERSGLQKGVEYDMQVSMTSEDGKRVQPDVIVFLPDKKHIIIDSKVSLVAYEAFVNAQSEEEGEKNIQAHIASVKNHIKGLSEKNYQSLEQLNTPDFVLLFMPIESSFSLTVQTDNELFNYAWERKIVIVSPSTLLATLRTISSIWKQERQTRNALEIAKQSGDLYDKFVGFIEDLLSIGKKMNDAKNSYDDAMKKLSSGKGNLIRRAETIKELGAKTTKDISQPLLERAKDSE